MFLSVLACPVLVILGFHTLNHKLLTLANTTINSMPEENRVQQARDVQKTEIRFGFGF